MPRFCVLASGSSGNSAYLESNGAGLLIDIGVGPRLISSRLAVVGKSWRNVNAVVLTHVHSDHWKDRTLASLLTHRIPLYCHPAHLDVLKFYGTATESLISAGLLRTFEPGKPLELPGGLRADPIAIPHDSEPTFGFRVSGTAGLFHDDWSLGYAADLGEMPTAVLELFRDVKLLALEFNHDEMMERSSGRPKMLIDRVLGEKGHLSNRQAADALGDLLKENSAKNLRNVVQLHLSRHCNSPELAVRAAQSVIRRHNRPVAIHTALQDQTTRMIEID